MDTMADTGADFTHTFRRLSAVAPPGSEGTDSGAARFLSEVLQGCASPKEMAEAFKPKIAPQQLQARGCCRQCDDSLSLACVRCSYDCLPGD